MQTDCYTFQHSFISIKLFWSFTSSVTWASTSIIISTEIVTGLVKKKMFQCFPEWFVCSESFDFDRAFSVYFLNFIHNFIENPAERYTAQHYIHQNHHCLYNNFRDKNSDTLGKPLQGWCQFFDVIITKGCPLKTISLKN